MLGPMQEAQAALVMRSRWKITTLKTNCCGRVIASLMLSRIRAHCADCNSLTGRPSVDPELLIYYPAVHA